MTHPFQSVEEVTLQEFVLFIKIHHKQIEENTNIYLNLDPSIAESDQKRVAMLLDSFLRLTTHTNIDELNEDDKSFFTTWLQSQLSIIDKKSFNLFQLIFEKALITFMIQQKSSRTNAILMYVLSKFTFLVQLYYGGDHNANYRSTDNQELKYLQLLDKLDKLLISSTGYQDLAYILKKCEEYFSYKRCVFYAYVPWSNQFYGVIGAELSKVQSMKGQLTGDNTILSSKKPIYLKNPKNYVKEEHIQLFNLSSIIFIPIMRRDQLFGWLTFDQLGEEFDCTKEELLLLEEVGNRLGLFLSRKGEKVEKNTELHLTERESMILGLLAEGYDNKKIGGFLFLSEHTVRDYVSSLMTKLKAKNRTQVVASAFRLGLLS
ncbi:response regulator transcription factor [Lysinibacillus irui]|uniref:Response regulator transcription factor n=1 Tax=Lysinibacillus irui TaxID=2998077 RepID=A0ABU5NGP6_9BACI|nr:response regulator transcription factor [Lysinibacillus irui]MEA0553856.1 response regulator transcription factor [Lysinibacillus irui]MEA0975202.1 response regulator transcription factor [Lysinibacillus irui]MEA1041356.1 response regulator transcription factor [Lysinibacillus irui]